MSKQGRVRLPREVVYSTAELAALLGITKADARNRCQAGLVPGAVRSGEGRMARWYVFKPMFDQSRQPAPAGELEALADRIIAALRQALAELRVTVSLGEVER